MKLAVVYKDSVLSLYSEHPSYFKAYKWLCNLKARGYEARIKIVGDKNANA